MASAIDVPPTTVSAWKSRGSIPARHWAKLVAQAHKARLESITLESLAVIHKEQRRHCPAKPPRNTSEEKQRKVRVKLEIDSHLLAEASDLGLNLERLAAEKLQEQVCLAKRARWQAEHADVLDWYNEHIERDGIFGDEWRTF